jgi:hypothetical protein
MRGRLLLLMLGALVLGCCSGGDSGSGPTEPSGIAQVVGTWDGTWTVSGVPVTTKMVLTQNGTALAGTFSVLGTPFDVQGTADSSLRISWHVVNASCGTVTGDGTANGLNPTRILGTIDLNTLGCPDNQHATGPVTWTREIAATAAPAPAGKRLTLEELGRAIAKLRP